MNNCVQFKDIIQDLIVEDKILLDKPATMRIDNKPIPAHMMGVNWPERQNKRKITVDIGEEGTRKFFSKSFFEYLRLEDREKWHEYSRLTQSECMVSSSRTRNLPDVRLATMHGNEKKDNRVLAYPTLANMGPANKKTILKQPTSAAIRKPSALNRVETSIIPIPQEFTPRSMKSNIQVILPKKLVDAELLLEKEAGSLFEEENDGWLNYELNHEEFKAALGMKIEGHDDEVVEERQPNHVSALTFGTIEMATRRSVSNMEGDILMGDHPTTLIGIAEDHDKIPEILQIKDSGLILGCITASKRDFPQVFFTKPNRINGVPFNKVLIYKGTVVNIMPYKRMEKLGKTKADLIPTELTVSTFAGTITTIHGI
ncbi:unnamed protein product [Prunus brigantina]